MAVTDFSAYNFNNGWPKGLRRKPVCTAEQWIAQVRLEAQEANVSPQEVLGADWYRRHADLRKRAWSALLGAGFSLESIADASGFSAASIQNACCPAFRAKKMARNLRYAASSRQAVSA